MLRADLLRSRRAAADVERRVRLLVRPRPDDAVLYLEVLAVVRHRRLFRPQPLHEADRLLHHLVALVVFVEDTLGGLLVAPRPGDQVDADAAFGELIERGEHLRHLRRQHVAGADRDQRLEAFRAGGDHRAGDPCFVTQRLDGYEHILETRRLRRQRDVGEVLQAGRDGGVRIAKGAGVAGRGDEPAESQWLHLFVVGGGQGATSYAFGLAPAV